jgi:hypothetical protein
MRFFSKINHFLLFSLIGLACQSRAQLAINLKPQNYNFKDQGYFYQSVIDMRSSTVFLGQLFQKNTSKMDLMLNGGTEKVFITQLNRNFQSKDGYLPLLIKIKALSFHEAKRADGLVDGKVELKLSVYALFDNDTTILCEPRSSSKYQRSLNSYEPSNFESILSELWVSCIRFTDEYIALNKSKIEEFNTGVKIIILPFETVNKRDTVHYLSRSVTWNDFRAEPHESKFSAAIFPTIALGTQLTIKDNKLIAVLKPQVYMIPSQSWAKDFAKDVSGLKHEQIHFDITKVLMDRLLKKLKNIEAQTIDDLSSIIQYEYLEAYREMNRIQDVYDSETNHNLNDGKQAQWAKKVQVWLVEPK